MFEYCKIQTLYKRDSRGIIIPSEYTYPEFEWLKECRFESTEKIDGANTSIELSITSGVEGIRYNVEYHGRTSKSNIPSHLNIKLHSLFDDIDWSKIFPNAKENDHITIYGEGYGNKIQAGGDKYIHDGVDFIMFDIRYNDIWLNRASLEDIASKLNIKVVPIIGYMTIQEAVDFVNNGFKSTIAENKDYDAEGLILKSPYGLKLRNGERVILKIKTIDFIKYKRVNHGN